MCQCRYLSCFALLFFVTIVWPSWNDVCQLAVNIANHVRQSGSGKHKAGWICLKLHAELIPAWKPYWYMAGAAKRGKKREKDLVICLVSEWQRFFFCRVCISMVFRVQKYLDTLELFVVALRGANVSQKKKRGKCRGRQHLPLEKWRAYFKAR